MDYIAQQVLLTLITCNSLTNRPIDFKTPGIYNSAFCISIQKKLNVHKIAVVTMIYQSHLVKNPGLGHS